MKTSLKCNTRDKPGLKQQPPTASEQGETLRHPRRPIQTKIGQGAWRMAPHIRCSPTHTVVLYVSSFGLGYKHYYLSKQSATAVPPSSPVARPIVFEEHLYVQNAVHGNEFTKSHGAMNLMYERGDRWSGCLCLKRSL